MATNVQNPYEANVRRLSLSYPVTSINHVDSSSAQLMNYATMPVNFQSNESQKPHEVIQGTGGNYTKILIRRAGSELAGSQKQNSKVINRQYTITPGGNNLGSSSTIDSQHLQRNSIAGTIEYTTPLAVSSGAKTVHHHYVPNYQQVLRSSPLTRDNSKGAVVYSFDTPRDHSTLVTSNRFVDTGTSSAPRNLTNSVDSITVPLKQSVQGSTKEVIKTIPVRSIAKSSKVAPLNHMVLGNQFKSTVYNADSVPNRRYLLKSMSAVLPGQIAVNSNGYNPKETLTITRKPSDTQGPTEKKRIIKSWVQPESHSQSVMYNSNQVGNANVSKSYSTYPVTSQGIKATCNLPQLKSQNGIFASGDTYAHQVQSARTYCAASNFLNSNMNSSCSFYFPDGQIFMRLPFQEKSQLLNTLLLVDEKISWFKPIQEKLKNKSVELAQKLLSVDTIKKTENSKIDSGQVSSNYCIQYTEEEAKDLLSAISSLCEIDEFFLFLAEKRVQELIRQLPISKITSDSTAIVTNDLAIDYVGDMGKKLLTNVLEKNTPETFNSPGSLIALKQEKLTSNDQDSIAKPELQEDTAVIEKAAETESNNDSISPQHQSPTLAHSQAKTSKTNENDLNDTDTEPKTINITEKSSEEQNDAASTVDTLPELKEDIQPSASEVVEKTDFLSEPIELPLQSSTTVNDPEPLMPVMSLQDVHKLNEVTLKNSENSLKNLSPGTLKRLQQEYLYSLTINTGGSINGVMRCVDVISIHRSPNILLMSELLTPSECHDILRAYEQSLKMPENLNLPHVENEMIVKLIKRRLATILKFDTENIEEFKIVKRQATDEPFQQRLAHNNTYAIIYLNDVQKGGLIEFESIGLHLTPKGGTAIVWMNTAEDGNNLENTISPADCTSYFILCKFNRCLNPDYEANRPQTVSNDDSVDLFKANTRKSQKLPKLVRKRQSIDEGKQPKLQTVEEELTL